MDKRLKNLTWKYFIQNKIKEIIIFALILAAIVFIPYLLGSSIGDNKSVYCGQGDYDGIGEVDCFKIQIWFEGLSYLLGGSIILFIVGLVLFHWIESNWEKAKKQAKEEMKK